MLNDKCKFSGQCKLNIDNGVSEIFDNIVIGYHPEVIKNISFDWEIVDYIKNDKEFASLQDGEYHVYFEGEIEIDDTWSYEWGEEYNQYSSLNYINFQRMDK